MTTTEMLHKLHHSSVPVTGGHTVRTPRARALGRALREAREETGIKLRAFADVLGRDPGLLSRWETGERTPTSEQVAQILTKLDVKGDRFDEIIALARGAHSPRWLAVTIPEQRQQFAALLELEETATRVTIITPLLMPGLLQTNDYIRTIMIMGAPPGEVSARLAARIGRKEVLVRPKPLHLFALVGEAALRQLVGSAEIMAGQLRYLLTMASWSNVDVRVIPFESGWHPGLEGPFVLLESKQWSPVVQLESRRSLLLLHEEADVVPYQDAAELVSNVALGPDESAGLISDYAERWEQAS
jgi:transcriptional regulator with XRE-family HTH domain